MFLYLYPYGNLKCILVYTLDNLVPTLRHAESEVDPWVKQIITAPLSKTDLFNLYSSKYLSFPGIIFCYLPSRKIRKSVMTG